MDGHEYGLGDVEGSMSKTKKELMAINRILRVAIKKHVADMDIIMTNPASYDRGTKVAESLCELETVLKINK